MKLVCCWQQNRLARGVYEKNSALPLPVLSRHFVRCAECRHAYEEMVRLNEELAQAFAIPAASEQFAQGICEKITARPVSPKRRASLGRVLAFSGGAAVLLCGIFLLQSRHNHPAITPLSAAENFPVKQPSSLFVKNHLSAPPKVAVERSPTVKPKPKSVTRVVRKKREIYLASYSPLKPYRRYRSLTLPPQTAPRAAFLSPELRSERWTQWASYYEHHGDYSHAADAYAQAYGAVPAESTAFCAGQAAENAGDVSQAVLYYSQILRQPLKQKPQTEKGTRLWNSEHDAA